MHIKQIMPAPGWRVFYVWRYDGEDRTGPPEITPIIVIGWCVLDAETVDLLLYDVPGFGSLPLSKWVKAHDHKSAWAYYVASPDQAEPEARADALETFLLNERAFDKKAALE